MNRKLRWISLAGILMATICHGAETMAYRFAAEPVISTPVAECPLLKQAPAPTPFVAAGDVLHDFTGVFREKKVLLENGWAVWNQTQHLLVVHGGMSDQWWIEELSGFREQTRQPKLTIDWIRSEKPEDLATKDASVFASLGLLGKSGQKSTASTKLTDPSGEWTFSVESEHTILHDGGLDISLNLSWQAPNGANQQHGNLIVSTAIADETILPVAYWYVVGHGYAWQINATADTLLSDGTSWNKARLRQVGEKISICRPAMKSSEWSTVREAAPRSGRKVLAKTFSRELFQDFSVPWDPDDKSDPFAEYPELPTTPPRNFPDAVIPDHLKNCFPNPALDMREVLGESGVALEADDFVAYDPFAERVVVDCRKDTTIDMIKSMLQVLGMRHPATIECKIWLADVAKPDSPLVKIVLLTKSGQRPHLQLLDEKDQPIVTFEFEPTLGADDSIVDLRYDFRCRLKQPTSLDWHNESALTLANGVPALTDATKLSDGRILKQGLRARGFCENPPTPE